LHHVVEIADKIGVAVEELQDFVEGIHDRSSDSAFVPGLGLYCLIVMCCRSLWSTGTVSRVEGHFFLGYPDRPAVVPIPVPIVRAVITPRFSA
jgi:hypothetical protein